MSSTLVFQAPASTFEPNFWEELYNKKLNVFKLDSSDQIIHCDFKISDGVSSQPFRFSSSSFDSTETVPLYDSCSTVLVNTNKIEEFNAVDKKELLKKVALPIIESISSGSAVDDPALLNRFVLLTFADLKQYKFRYWFAAPVLVPAVPFATPAVATPDTIPVTPPPVSLAAADVKTCVTLYRALRDARLRGRPQQEEAQSSKSLPLAPPPQCIFGLAATTGALLTLREAWTACESGNGAKDVVFVVIDNTASPGAVGGGDAASTALGWATRNFLALLTTLKRESKIGWRASVINLRGKVAQALMSATVDALALQAMLDEDIVKTDRSVYFEVEIRPSEVVFGLASPLQPASAAALTVVGWEPNERGRPGPRLADLSSTMDSRFLMAQSVDLNLRLMRWRMWPSLDTARLAQTQCLLLGAGTLGCAVARALLGWGVRNITLLDSGRVAYSNPVRQTLFEFEDAQKRKFKAVAAAERLRKIFPDVNSNAVIMNIPMPGHPFSSTSNESAATGAASEVVLRNAAAYEELATLVQAHDVVFALTDSREARWLPTALCAAYDKPMINSALGFDSYLVMRHGHGCGSDTSAANFKKEDEGEAGRRLGCYFCNDIVAAANSQHDRTLDQQCTVTRPGLSFIASALAVEMMVALLHSPLGSRHPAPAEADGEQTVGGEPIPHQIRGSVASFTQMNLQTTAFDCCTACSPPIVQALRAGGAGFVQQACADPKSLEQLSGAAALVQAVELDAQCEGLLGDEDDF